MSQQRRTSGYGSAIPDVTDVVPCNVPVLDIQTRGIPLPGMVPPRSNHSSPVQTNPAHGFINPLGPTGHGQMIIQPSSSAHLAGMSPHQPCYSGLRQGRIQIMSFVRNFSRSRLCIKIINPLLRIKEKHKQTAMNGLMCR